MELDNRGLLAFCMPVEADSHVDPPGNALLEPPRATARVPFSCVPATLSLSSVLFIVPIEYLVEHGPARFANVPKNRCVQLSADLDPRLEAGSSLSLASLAGLLSAPFA